jgi:DNA polymerase-1
MELPSWVDDAAASEAIMSTKPKAVPSQPILPIFKNCYAKSISYIQTKDAAVDFVNLAKQTALSHVGIDFEYRYSSPAIALDRDKTHYDIRSVKPLLCAVTLAEYGSDKEALNFYTAVFDVRVSDVHEALQELLMVPVCFVGHHLQSELFCLWQLKQREMPLLWDTFIAEKSFSLGLNHYRNKLTAEMDDRERIDIKENIDKENENSLKLVNVAQRHGLTHQMSADKESLQSSFLTHADGADFSQQQIEYAAEDAIVVAQLYLPQVQKAALEGVLQHLINIEMPWICTNARMIWNGVRVDNSKRDLIVNKATVHETTLAAQMATNVNSYREMLVFFKARNLLQVFSKKDGRYSFSKERLEEVMHADPVIETILQLKKANSVKRDKILRSDLDSVVDGRVHARFIQLGTNTGRQTCTTPNLLGIPAVLRPVIIPADGYGIGEVDLSQIEPGIAGAVFHNKALIDMYNSGDIYTAMARLFYKNKLTAEDLALSAAQFKKQHPKWRQQMKVCTLGILYGLSSKGLANKLEGVDEQQAGRMMNEFMELFPGLKETLQSTVTLNSMRGFSQANTGLRRLVDNAAGVVKESNANWLKNHPVQASAACVFKVAGNRLDKLYQQYDARLLISLHDSFVFEAPLKHLQAVADMTAQVMKQAVMESFPALKPLVDINIHHPQCWNKDGKFDSIETWTV